MQWVAVSVSDSLADTLSMSCGYERPLSARIPQRRRLCHALPSNAKCTAKKWGLLGQLLANAHANKAFNCNPKDWLLRADLNVLIYTYIRNARIDVFFIRRGIFLSALRAQSNTNNSNNDKEQRGASQVARAQMTDYTFAYTEVFFFPFFRLAGGTSLTRLPPLFFGPWMRRGCCLNECAMLMHFFCNNARHKKHCLLLWAPRRIETCEQVRANGISLALVCVSDIGNWRRGKRNAHFPNSSASKNLLISHLIAKPKSNYPNCNYNSEQRIN